MLACGVPISLTTNSDGTAAREGLRRFLTTTIRPVAKIIETELQAKLDPAAALTFGELAASTSPEKLGPSNSSSKPACRSTRRGRSRV